MCQRLIIGLTFLALLPASPARPEALLPGAILVGTWSSTPGLILVNPADGSQHPMTAGAEMLGPFALVVSPDRMLYVLDDDASVHRVDGISGVRELLSPSASLTRTLALGPDGSLYSWSAGGPVRIDTATGEHSPAAPDIPAFSPWAVEVGHDGRIYAGSSNRFFWIDPGTGVATEVDLPGGPWSAEDMAIDPMGRLVVAAAIQQQLLRIDPDTWEVEILANAFPWGDPIAVDVAEDGTIVVLEQAWEVGIEGTGVSVYTLASDGVWPRKVTTDLPSTSHGIAVVSAWHYQPADPCSDGWDNDGDRAIDASDPGCSDTGGQSEQSVSSGCDDGLDDDGDTLVDYPDDPGCDARSDRTETRFDVECDDGWDNDGNGLADYPEEPGCSGPRDKSELASRCGLGFELGPLLACLLAAMRRRRAVA